MSPLKHSNNLAARMGRWSANHWKTAVFGWIAFVVASVLLGSAIGTKHLEPTDLAVGEAGRAQELIDSGFPNKADEQSEIVLIQSKTLEADSPAFRAVVEDVSKTLSRFPQVRRLTPAARRRARRPRLRGPPLGHGAVQPQGRLRRSDRLHRDDPGRSREDGRLAILGSRLPSSEAPAPARRPTRPSARCSPRRG